VESHQEQVFRVALAMTGNRAEAEDVAQDAFLRAYRARLTFRGDSSIGTWLYRITLNVCLDRFARDHGRGRTFRSWGREEQDSGVASLQSEDDPERSTESSLVSIDIHRALKALTPRERAVFVLRHFEDLPLKDVASTLSIRVGTVKSLLYRAMVKLQKELSYYREEVKR
jgi:RNA polymerase sigma-70 factor (ECF subfamily)